MRISSPAFNNGGTIPERYTRDGGNKWPTLRFYDVPATAQSLALIVGNPDAPRGAFTHWIVFNISPATRELNEDAEPGMLHQGRNDYGQDDYAAPISPSPEHQYYFRLYALDTQLPLSHGISRLRLESSMIGHVIAEAEIQGHFAAPVPVGVPA
jgi:hypothetical protein